MEEKNVLKMNDGVYIRYFPGKKEVFIIFNGSIVRIRQNQYEEIEIEYLSVDSDMLNKIKEHFRDYGMDYETFGGTVTVIAQVYDLNVRNYSEFLRKVSRSEEYLKYLLNFLFPI